MNFDHISAIHFVGIGGIGMSGIAGILAEAGVAVSGCDLKKSAATELLSSRGIDVAIGHDPAHLEGVDLVVVTAAVKGVNEEIEEARRRGIRVLRRSEMLGEIVNARRGVGISGTHGKTTTSAMVTCVLEEAGLDPTFLVGGMMGNFGTNARAGRGDYFVVEADEYDRTFHQLRPDIAIVTNIEADHLDYYGSFDAIVEAFGGFIRNVREGGVVIGCVDDPTVAALLDRAGGGAGAPLRTVRYSLSDAKDLAFHERGSSFE